MKPKYQHPIEAKISISWTTQIEVLLFVLHRVNEGGKNLVIPGQWGPTKWRFPPRDQHRSTHTKSCSIPRQTKIIVEAPNHLAQLPRFPGARLTQRLCPSFSPRAPTKGVTSTTALERATSGAHRSLGPRRSPSRCLPGVGNGEGKELVAVQQRRCSGGEGKEAAAVKASRCVRGTRSPASCKSPRKRCGG